MHGFLFAWLGIEWLSVPLPITLACACISSYVVGRFGLKWSGILSEKSKDKPDESSSPERAVGELKLLAESIRLELTDHEKGLAKFQKQVDKLNEADETSQPVELAREAQDMLAATRDLAGKISRAYEEIRHQSEDLAGLTRVRRGRPTGVQDRKALENALRRMFAMRVRYGLPFSLVSVAIDQGSDDAQDADAALRKKEALRDVASLTIQTARDTDLVARHGDGRFVALLPYAKLEAAIMFAHRLREKVAAELPVTISAGVAAASDVDDPATLIKRCTESLTLALGSGPNTVAFDDGESCLLHEDRDPEDTVSQVEQAIENVLQD